MGAVLPYTPHMLVFPLLLSPEIAPERVVDPLQMVFGPLEQVGPALPFTFTRYYEPEMGAPLTRLFYAASTLVDPGSLGWIKTRTNELEERLAVQGNRVANIDPGLLCESRFTLATTKDSSHRVAVGGGIYAEITLVFERGEFRPLPWTYPDYRSPEYRTLLRTIRDAYRRQLKKQARDTGSA